jgi:hypothetical protein
LLFEKRLKKERGETLFGKKYIFKKASILKNRKN